MTMTLKKWWVLAHIILIIFLIVCPYYFIFYADSFEKKVEYRSDESGSIDSPFSYDIITKTNNPINQDYSMFVNFESNGAFIAGREIKVSIDLLALTSRISNSELIVVFPGALDYPIQEGNGIWNDASVTLKFVNESFAHGEKNIIYLMPEFYNQSVIVFKRDNAKSSQILPAGLYDKYTYSLIINGTQQKESNFIRKNGFVYISPLETSLQLDTNNFIVFLTFVAIYLAVLQVFISISPFSSSKGQNSK
jgi:hypothetical protein